MRYAEFPPPPELATAVRCLWVFEGGAAAPAVDRIVPDGQPELIFHVGEPYREVCAGLPAQHQAPAVFAGQLTGPCLLFGAGYAQVIGVRFHPGQAHRLAGTSMRELNDQRIPLPDLRPQQIDGLLDQLASEPDTAIRIGVVAGFVASLLRPQRHAPQLDQCIELIRCSPSRPPLDELMATAGWSARQLERRFMEYVGIPPRLLASVFRFRSLFDVLAVTPGTPLAQVAAEAGYFDQPQLNRDFRRFLGCPPRVFLAERRGLAAAISDRAVTSETYNR